MSAETGRAITARYELKQSRQSTALMAHLDAKPGAVPVPYFPARATTPLILMYKIMEKIFAIVSVRGDEGVILKCDPDLVPMLREQFAGIGHRSHLDARYWISVSLDSDVPAKEIKRLADQSYQLVYSGLSKKQKAEFDKLISEKEELH